MLPLCNYGLDMTETRWFTYVQRVTGGIPATDAADFVGIDKSNFTRWKKGSKPTVDFVLKLARAYSRPVLEALAEAEYITDAEARLREVKVGVEDLSDSALARELLRRIEERSNASGASSGVGGAPQTPNVTQLRPGQPDFDLEQEPYAAYNDEADD